MSTNPVEYLKVKDITMKFGGLTALSEVSFNVKKGEIFSIIGPNGAGKTTLFNIISGIYEPVSGEVLLNNKPIQGTSPHKICQVGLSRTFQSIRLFDGLNVFENILCARHCRTKGGVLTSFLRLNKQEREKAKEYSYNLLKEFGLDHVCDQVSDKLSYGDQRRLEMVRALATEPHLLLLDEPAAGLNPSEVEKLMDMIKKLSDRGITILLVEHRMNLVMNISDKIVVLNYGKKLAEGKPEDIQKNEDVINAYLGLEVSCNA